MNQLTKLKDVSTRYNVTTSSLRYYEKMGLLKSTRDESSGYRLFDETALVRLRQILILRKMNISIEDIGRIFASQNSDTVLSVLDKKVDDIDSEVALLHELKEIVLAFIQQIRQVDFHNDADVKKLFDKASEIETALVKDNAFIETLLNTTDELDATVTSLIIEPKSDAKKVDKNKTNLQNYEVIKVEARRFIGKAVYARAIFDYETYNTDELPVGTLFGNLWQQSNRISEKLDAISEYSTHDALNIGLHTWEKFDHNNLQGYWVGRFMKADTPVPEGLDYIDFPEMYMAKGVAKGDVNLAEGRTTGAFFIEINQNELLVREEMERQGKHNFNGSFTAEVYNQTPNAAGHIFGWETWVSCNAKPIQYDLKEYIGKQVTIKFSAEVKRSNAEGDLVWVINDRDKWPAVSEVIWGAENDVWHKMSGEWTGCFTNNDPFLYVNTWNPETDLAEYEVRDFSMEVTVLD